MSAHDEFLAQIEAAPFDAVNLLVYADWLDDRGDDRAEYLRAQVELRNTPATKLRTKSELRRRLRILYPGHEISWVSRLEQCGAVDANLTSYAFAWPSALGLGLQRVTLRYCHYYELPPLPTNEFDGSFAWLGDESSHGAHPDAGSRWERFLQRTGKRGYHVPPALVGFMGSHLPQHVRPTFSEYYIEQPESESFTWDDEHLFVTMCASSAVIFGVLLPRVGSYCPVVCGPPGSFYSVDISEAGEAQTYHTYGARALDRLVVAPHIEAFVYRSWIESSIFHTLRYDETRGLNDQERAYHQRFTAFSTPRV